MKVLFIFFISCIAHADNKVKSLWNEWYVFTQAGTPVGFYQEQAEHRIKDKQYAISQNWVELENGKVETYIGSVVSSDASLTPIAFFSEKKSSGKTSKLDGRVKNSTLNLTLKQNNITSQKKIPLKKDMQLSNMVGIMLSKKIGVAPISFTAIVEDPKDSLFDSRQGQAKFVGANKDIKGNHCRKVEMIFDGIPSEWWITNEGKLCEVSMLQTDAKIQLTTEAEARKIIGK